MLVPAPAPLEYEVVDFFTQFRGPLLRYVSALGLPLHDGEEIVQEVFLALFQHLRERKPKTNLKGWVFRVAHNLALKQRTRNGRREKLHRPEDESMECLAPRTESGRACCRSTASREVARDRGNSAGNGPLLPLPSGRRAALQADCRSAGNLSGRRVVGSWPGARTTQPG